MEGGGGEAYRECLRNHAASLGSYATDGCGEFTLDDSSTAPASLNCAACGCHRNFHRKVILVAATIGGGGSSSSLAEEERMMSSGGGGGKKRVRTKFTAEQKEKMLGFAEELGWRIRRKEGEDDEIERFCRGLGVSRQVFKVWMHNHKSPSSPSTLSTQ